MNIFPLVVTFILWISINQIVSKKFNLPKRVWNKKFDNVFINWTINCIIIIYFLFGIARIIPDNLMYILFPYVGALTALLFGIGYYQKKDKLYIRSILDVSFLLLLGIEATFIFR
ncbi:DUF4181 domain-containing protein [Pseudalkalibacillus hwajinpoensis]|uniref:DUF4181 domain-containing protein n=1 Tax=Guptibacillus hwajinpoensis TaxID=208199 RepID=UPI0026B6F087